MKQAFSKVDFDLYSEGQLESWLAKCGMGLKNPKAIVDAIMALSDIYNGAKGSPDIWSKPAFVAAYLCYFLPLNYLRCRYVLNQAPITSKKVIDYGAGIGAFTLAILKNGEEKNLDWPQITAVEPSGPARKWMETILKDLKIPQSKVEVVAQLPPQSALKDSAVLFSYSLNEIGELPAFTTHARELFIVEPSLQNVARKLQAMRLPIIQNGFQILAPCLHHEDCPLLVHSKTDWCHTRMHINMPTWFLKLESQLPIKNQSLTLSYLSARKDVAFNRAPNEFRVIGDTLFEKGKTRQAVCRSVKREYFSWLKRDGDAPIIDRGLHIQVESEMAEVSNEIRAVGVFKFKIN